jgi:hypothetical protein
VRFDELDAGELAAQQIRRVGGQECALYSDALDLWAKPSEIVGRMLRGVEARTRHLKGWRPELPEVLLVGLHQIPDIGRLVGATSDVDEQRQIAANANRVEMIEEKEPVATEKLLDVVL